MLKYDFGTIVKTMRAFQAINGFMIAKENDDFKEKNVSDGDLKALHTLIDALSESISGLPLKITDLAILELKKSLKDGVKYKKMASGMNDVGTTLRRELSTLEAFCIEQNAKQYFDFDAEQISKTFGTDFPSVIYEIDEAGKCFALSRPTACVFHLMRVMEIGVRSTAKCLGIPDPTKGSDKNWGAMLAKIKQECDARNNPPRWNNNDKELFASLYASLDAVRVAWRNTTMHIENKYTDDEAEHIFFAVRGFMRVLSSRMNEAGQPSA